MRAQRVSAVVQFAAVVVGVALKAWAEREASGRPPRSGARHAAHGRRSHGRDGASPARIPASHWKDILLRTWREFNEDQIPAVAGSVAYSTVVAIFPALAAFISLYGLFFDVNEVHRELGILSGFLPSEALNLIEGQMMRIAQNRHANLGPFLLGIGISLWSANAGMKAMMRGLNIAYEERETRGFVRMNLESLSLTIGGVVLMLLISAATIVAPLVLRALHLEVRFGGLALVRWPLMLAITLLALAVLYRFGPSRARPRWRWITPGSVGATVLWILGSVAFSWVVGRFGKFNATYGSLGALFGFLTWLWLSAVIVLAGAELNCEVERQAGLVPPPRSPPRSRSPSRKGRSP